MPLWDDERAQSIQVGAVLLFAIVVIAFSTYQATVVPQQNREVEFDHNRQVQSDLQDLRNAVVSTSGGGSQRSVSVALGTRYPSRAIARNPGPASGTLRTDGTGDPDYNVSIGNARATGETGDVWDGTPRNYTTGAVVYDPNYNLYTSAPVTTYEHTALFDEFEGGSLVVANQTLVDGRTISVVTVNGSLSRSTTGSTSVDVRPVSASERTVLVRAADASEPVTLSFTSRLSASTWEDLFAGQSHVRDVVPSPTDVSGPYHGVTVELDPSVSYRLRMAKVGLGTGVAPANASYLTVVDGEGATVEQGQRRDLTLEVRDAYNNPVANVSVNASAGSGHGSIADGRRYTGTDGRVTFTYETTASTDVGTHRVNVTLNRSGALAKRPFDQSRPANASLNVTVQAGGGGGGGGGGAYAVNWKDPSATSGNGGADLSSCDADACTWDVGGSDDATLDLNSTLSPSFEGVSLEYAVSNATVGTVSPGSATTGSAGAATTTLTANANGSVDVLASANGGSDVIEMTVVNVTGGGGGGGGTSASQVSLVTGSGATFWSGGVTFDVDNGGSSPVTIQGVTVNSTSVSSASQIAEGNGESYAAGQHEVYVDADTDGVLDVDGQPYSNDPGTALAIGTRAAMTEDGTLNGGSTATVSVYQFQNGGGSSRTMSGQTVTVTFHFADGSAATFSVST